MSDNTDNAIKAPDVVHKWGPEVAGRGFAQLPNYLLLLNQFLDDDHRLSPVELLLLLQLVGGWWKKEALPFPSIGTLARRCGVSDRQIQRALVRLEKLKFVERTKRRGKRGLIASNAYDLSPLVEVLQEIAKAFPNEFPRAVTHEQRKAISARLTPVGITAGEPMLGTPALQEGPPVNVVPPSLSFVDISAQRADTTIHPKIQSHQLSGPENTPEANTPGVSKRRIKGLTRRSIGPNRDH